MRKSGSLLQLPELHSEPMSYLWGSALKYANINKLAAGHKYETAALTGRWGRALGLLQFQGSGFHPRTLRVNLWPPLCRFRPAVTLVSVRRFLMYASNLNPIHLFRVTGNNSRCEALSATGPSCPARYQFSCRNFLGLFHATRLSQFDAPSRGSAEEYENKRTLHRFLSHNKSDCLIESTFAAVCI